MLTNNFRLKCDLCGRLMSFHDAHYAWIPYGSSNAVEPPDEEHAHEKCYNNWDKDLLYRTSWVKPYLIMDLKHERKKKLERLNDKG